MKFKCCSLLIVIVIKLTTFFGSSNVRTLYQMHFLFAHSPERLMLLTVCSRERKTILTFWSNLTVLRKKTMALGKSTRAMQTQDLDPQIWSTRANTRELQVLQLLFVCFVSSPFIIIIIIGKHLSAHLKFSMRLRRE